MFCFVCRAPGTVYVLSCNRPIIINTSSTDHYTQWPSTLSGYSIVFNYSGDIVQHGEVNVQSEWLFKVSGLVCVCNCTLCFVRIMVVWLCLYQFDSNYHHKKLEVNTECVSVTSGTSTERVLAFGNIGFSRGVHYWEVHVNAADHGSVFIGIAPKPTKEPFDMSSTVGRWSGWGFVNFRATIHKSTEKVYGEFFTAGDIIGVRLDMDQGMCGVVPVRVFV